MKKTFYCVMSEYYENGTVKTAIITRACKIKPKDKSRTLPFMTAYTDWFENRELAEAFLSERKAA